MSESGSGHSRAALVPYGHYLKFVQADEAGILKGFDDVLVYLAVVNAKYSEEEVEADLADATIHQ